MQTVYLKSYISLSQSSKTTYLIFGMSIPVKNYSAQSSTQCTCSKKAKIKINYES